MDPDVLDEPQVGEKRSMPDPQSDKPRRKYARRAAVWKNYLIREDDPTKCNCKYCGLELCCDSKLVGTSSLIGHISRCKMFKEFDEKEKQKVLSDDKGNMRVVAYDPHLFRKSVNELVVVNGLPLTFVDSEGWKRFCFNVLPLYSPFSRRTCTRNIVAMYEEEKVALRNLFTVEKQRVSLTTDIWTSPTTSINYMVVTCHWINANWEMQKRIVSFKVITDHRGETIARQLLDCLEEWGIEKVFTITVDNARNNDKALGFFKDELRLKGVDALVSDGDFLHMRCCAHILNLIVGDGLKCLNSSILAIRNAIKYVRSSFSRLRSFALKCETWRVCRGSLPLDIITRWNSTYLMLSSAIKLRVAFEKMRSEDKLYCDYFMEEDEKTKSVRVGPPTNSDWDEAVRLVSFLKFFYKSTLAFSASQSVTSTLAYNEIVNVKRALITKCGSPVEDIRKQAHVMRDKFEKYWDGLENMNPLVIMASIFDPRNKMKFASLCFDQLYGKGTIENRRLTSLVTGAMKQLYAEYKGRLSKPSEAIDGVEVGSAGSQAAPGMCEVTDDEDDFEPIETMYSKMVQSRDSDDGCGELDIYLTEKTELRVKNSLGMPYDVLNWWKCNSPKFPILSEFARDVLATQISSVASESAFSTSGRVLDPYRSSLTPYMVEVLVCLQQWLRCSYKSQGHFVNLTDMLADVEFYESLDSRNSIPPTSHH